MKKKLIASAVAASLWATTALAHTNSIGYVGDGNGGINFWYGSWHDNTQFNEAEIQITRPDGTTSIDAFNLLSQDSPAGLLSGINYFGSDGTQLIPYDINTGGGESYTWQGINYANLPTGQYTFTYIPLGDPLSNLPGSPTMEWVPMDQVIRSLTITLTQNDINGDANANGILDTTEVGVGDATAAAAAAANGPTVVSQGSSQVIAYVAVNGGVVQVVQSTQTDTTWDNMSDGTTANTQSTTTPLPDVTGRIDQIATAQDVIASTVRAMGFNNIQGVRMTSKMDNGMTGNTTGSVIGGSVTGENGVTVGGGITRLDTRLTGNSDSVDADTTILGASIGRELEKGDLTVTVKRADTDYSYDRTIGDFGANAATNGTDTSVSLQFSPHGDRIRPVFGYTRGKRTMDGYAETGDAQVKMLATDTSEMYSYGTIGLTGDLGVVDFSVMHHTDGVNDISLGLEKDTGRVTWRVEGTRSMTDLGDTNSVTAGIRINF